MQGRGERDVKMTLGSKSDLDLNDTSYLERNIANNVSTEKKYFSALEDRERTRWCEKECLSEV